MVLLSSAARTATTDGPQVSISGKRYRGIIVYLDVTANPGGAETLSPQVQALDPASAKFLNVTAYPVTAAAANASYIYELYPGAVETVALANHEVMGGSLPQTFRVKVTHSSTGSWTYTLGAHLVF